MKLQEYLKTNKISVIAFAKKLGRSRAAVYRYLDGSIPKNEEDIQKIYLLTGGCVTANDFYNLDKIKLKTNIKNL